MTLLEGDCLDILPSIASGFADFGIVDPPYCLDGMGTGWNKDRLKRNRTDCRQTVVGGLPAGMKFDRRQGVELAAFMAEVSKEMFRILKPGSFFIAFSQARLYHNLASAVDASGFEIRDMLGWTYEGQAKAFAQDHFVRKMDKTEEEKSALIASMAGRKTPQLKPMIEPMVLAQKPKEGTFAENWQKWGVGLVDTTQTLDGKFPGQLMAVAKPSRDERAEIDHPTIKPWVLLEHLIKLFTKPGDVVLDPCAGSGTTGVAAFNTGRYSMLIERDAGYCDIIRNRLNI